MDILLARQPIFDGGDRIAAYELFFRASARSSSTTQSPPAPERILADAVLGFGLDRIAEHERVFLSITPELLIAETVRVLPPTRVVLQLDASTAPTPELIEAASRLTWDGYAIALANVGGPVSESLARVAAIAKVDVRGLPDATLADLAGQMRAMQVRLLAENVEHRAEQQQCINLGFQLFQGVRFSRPQTLVRKDRPVAHVHTYRLLKLLRTSSSQDAEIEDLLKRDVTLTYKLLRIVNAAAIGGREIWSIGHAIRLLGREALARWVTLLLLSDIGDSGIASELTHMAMTRARHCELLASDVGVPRANQSLFLVGLLSLLDQLLQMPMEDLTREMELAPDVRDALLYRTDFFGEVLSLVESHAEGAWDASAALGASLGVSDDVVAARYVEALSWAAEQDPRRTTMAA
jgi:EAL and modified HD-GYP domain-containing signal transduction protein